MVDVLQRSQNNYLQNLNDCDYLFSIFNGETIAPVAAEGQNSLNLMKGMLPIVV
jgi:tyrosine-protein phosphatase YwqE